MGAVPLQLSRKLSKSWLFVFSSDDIMRSIFPFRVRVLARGLRIGISGMVTAMLKVIVPLSAITRRLWTFRFG